MGYTSKDILDDIHKAEPLPSKGKMTKIVKKENANKSLDAALTDEQYQAASFIYGLIKIAYKVKIQDLYNPKLEAVNSEALETLTEAEEADKPTALDNLYKQTCEQFVHDNKDFEYIYANRVLQFYGYNIQDLFTQANVEPPLSLFDGGKLSQLYLKDTIGQTKFLRSANHLLLLNHKGSKYQVNAFLKHDSLKKSFDGFKKTFKEVAENFEKNTLNDEINIGVDPYVINAFVGLINKVAKVNGRRFNIKPIAIPKDKVAPEKEKAIQKNNSALEKFQKTKIGNFIGNLANKATQKAMSGMGIAGLAKKLKESQEIKDNLIQAISEEHPEFQGKTFQDLENEWKTPHCKELDLRDKNFLTKAMEAWKTGEDLKKYWDNQENLDKFFDVISRQLYLTTNKKQYLYIWDQKQNYICLKGDEKYSNYVDKIELNNREQDSDDMEQYELNRANSGIDDYIAEYQDSQEEPDFDEVFENQYPSIKDYNTLVAVVNVIANAKPLTQVLLNQELGSCYPTQDWVNRFKYYQSKLTPENQASLRWQIYDDLNKLIVGKVSIKETAIQMERYLNESC